MVHLERSVAPPTRLRRRRAGTAGTREPDDRNRAQLRTVRIVVIEEATASNRS